ncbi:MAG: HAMP domain-containing sensor histidine kinase [Pseudomonadota bacterium]
MPNRADHSVKTPKGHRRAGVKTFAMTGGIIVAVIGALAAMFVGGQDGMALGAGVLTTIIFSQIISPHRRHSSSNQGEGHLSEVTDTSEPGIVPGDAPVLVLNVSPLGRVRSLSGHTDWFPGLRVGSEITRFIAPDAETVEIRTSSGPGSVSVSRLPFSKGEVLLLLPASQAGDALQQELLERTNFFAGLGHDLKSPLNAVIGFADIMDAEIRGPMPEAYQDYPGLIRESGATLLRLVEDMLTYAKSEAGTYELDLAIMDVAASGENVLRQSRAMADQAEVILKDRLNDETLAMADADAVHRIWDNLVSNAIKYSPPGSAVTLSAYERGDAVYLQVSDQGAGMDADDLARIAKPFAQGRNAKGRPGTGLGLTMVHRMAEMQGGTVEIRTGLGQGTTVTVRLPALSQSRKRAAE